MYIYNALYLVIMRSLFTKNNLKISAVYVLEPQGKCLIPFAQSLVSAGFPSSAENFVENSLDLNDLLIHHPAATFYVRVLGNSMINAGINSGDILIVDRSLTVSNNKIAIVRINDEFTVKRIRMEGDTIFLIAENDEYKAIEISKDMDVEVWGVVTFVIHKM